MARTPRRAHLSEDLDSVQVGLAHAAAGSIVELPGIDHQGTAADGEAAEEQGHAAGDGHGCLSLTTCRGLPAFAVSEHSRGEF